jgi:hypothetical protein
MPAASNANLQRRFSVHGVEEAPSRGYLVDGVGFEDAALHYLEDRHVEAADDEVSLMVEDCATGERQCFRVDLTTHETAPCD